MDINHILTYLTGSKGSQITPQRNHLGNLHKYHIYLLKLFCTLNIQRSSQRERNSRTRDDENILNTNRKIKTQVHPCYYTKIELHFFCHTDLHFMFRLCTSQMNVGPLSQGLNEGYTHTYIYREMRFLMFYINFVFKF